MDKTQPAPTEIRVGPAERPDDPIAAAIEKATRRTLSTVAHTVDPARRSAPPTPDQEGCYYLG
jgi:hypothetical protein